MHVEVEFEGGKTAAGLYIHQKLPEAMGNSVAAFAHAMLQGQTQPGVWYPEEKEALSVSEEGRRVWQVWGACGHGGKGGRGGKAPARGWQGVWYPEEKEALAVRGGEQGMCK
jgi:hypothetical protein